MVLLANGGLPWWGVRCSPWPIKACHGDGEVEMKMVEGGEVEVCVVEIGGNVWMKMEAYGRS